METILITGASSGMGKEMAIRFSDRYRIILNGRSLTRLEDTLSQCKNQDCHLIWQYDLENIDEIESSYSFFAKKFEIEVNHLVYCAGIIKTYPLKMVTPNVLRSLFSINVFAGELLAKVLVNKKVNGDKLKDIVYISSNISNFGAKAHSIYGASKSAIDGVMRSLAVELAPRIRVNSILPGAVHTPMCEDVFQQEDLVRRMEASYPLGLGTVTDIYGAANFLISEEARWITGQQIVVDGGKTIDITG